METFLFDTLFEFILVLEIFWNFDFFFIQKFWVIHKKVELFWKGE